jgi:hypothetical protein
MTDKHPKPVALSELLDQCGPGGPDHPVVLPQSWTQGRTAFGGLSGALAYQAASHIEADLPPLRSAQIAFTGPLFSSRRFLATRALGSIAISSLPRPVPPK